MVTNTDEFRCKEVINIRTGVKLGYPDDIEFETHTAKVIRVVIKGKLRLFGLLGRAENIVIPWSEIEVVGEDTILVTSEVKR